MCRVCISRHPHRSTEAGKLQNIESNITSVTLGKTTRLDALSFRKNTGSVRGLLCVNGRCCDKNTLHKISGCVEQLVNLHTVSTTEEAIRFSASIRLKPRGSYSDSMSKEWSPQVLKMLELTALKYTLIDDNLIFCHSVCISYSSITYRVHEL